MLGDVVVTTALIKPLKDALPDAKLYYLVQEAFIPILEDHPDIEGCIADPLPYSMLPKHKPDFKALVKKLKAERFDGFIGLWENDRYGTLARKAGIPIRLGHRSSLSNWFNYTHSISQDYLDYTQHKVDSNLALLAPLGVQSSDISPVDLRVSDARVAALHQRFPWSKDPYVMVHIDAGTPQRVLPAEHFVSILQYCKQLNIPKVILFGREKSTDLAKEILSKMDQDSSIEVLVKSTDLSDVTTLISQCRFLIGSDSGPAHIATAFQKPVIVYYFNRIQNAMHWGPWMSPHTIIKSKHDCIDACRPNICRKPDCRTHISMPAFKEAIDNYWHNRVELPANQRHYWLEKTLNIGVFGPQSTETAETLSAQGYNTKIFDLEKPYKVLIDDMNAHNTNLFVYTESTLPKRHKLKLTILQRWLANRIHFFPKIKTAGTPFEALQAIADMGEV